MRNRTTFQAFKNYFNGMPVFSVNDVTKIYPQLDRPRRLHEWASKGYIERLIKGYYIFSDVRVTEPLLFFISNRIYSPSYVSLQSALSYYGLIPELVPGVTSVSPKKTTTLTTSVGNLMYFSVKSVLMFGYKILEIPNLNLPVKMAEPEKALLDLLYLNPSLSGTAQFAEMRVNVEEVKSKINMTKLDNLLKYFENKALTRRVKSFKEWVKHA